MIPETLKVAFAELGQKEIKGSLHNKRILEYQEMTGLDFGNDETPWCSIFANWVALQANVPMSNSAMAKSWLKVGRKTVAPKPGDVVVFWRRSRTGPYGHVSFFIGYSKDGDDVLCIGGNQNDEVNITSYPLTRVLQFRRIDNRDLTNLEIPVGYLRKGDNNNNVKLLQLILIKLNYLNGSADGDFGKMTEAALKKFQKENNITVDGIYGSESRNILVDLLIT